MHARPSDLSPFAFSGDQSPEQPSRDSSPRLRAVPFAEKQAFAAPTLSFLEVERYALYYLNNCSSGLSPKTILGKRDVFDKLLWFLKRADLDCDESSLHQFFAYIQHGHKEVGG